ncbi:hypothetical protein [Nonomuraea sp. NEAU-A123]|uniref:hypothetical protein n=1 Tax=Nonomuraea sp. NEAU-A123 TaxID=2839649 RepID=UPI0020321CFB|nr:hypothetical protein [Nonomuraea sp. NEAU-A123]
MPSPAHDTLNALFRSRPAFAVEILRDVFDVDLPTDVLIEVAGGDFNDRPSLDFQADTVITVGPRQDPIFGVIVEIQQDIKEHKRTAWARYAAALWLQLKCPVVVLALCPNARVATWATEPIVTSLPGFVLQPSVFGPDRIPVITDHVQAADCLELAAMSVMMHGHQRVVTEAFMTAVGKLADGHASQYYEYGYRLASLPARRIMEEIMSSAAWPVYSPFAKEHFGKGELTALIRVLEARGISVPQDAHDRIAQCTDRDQIEEWIDRAATATTLGEVFPPNTA